MAEQLAIDFRAANARADRGISRAIDHAERSIPGWTDMALEALRQWVSKQTDAFTIEQARAAIASSVERPPELRSWGAVTRAAKNRGLIVLDGVAPAASSNGSPKPTYRRGMGC